MIAIQQRFHVFLIAAGIVLSTALGGCGGGAESSKAIDGTTIAASTPSVANIYIATSASSNKQSTMNFSVTKAGTPLANIGVTVTLNPQALAAGATFFGGSTTLSLTTSAAGVTPNFSIISGNIPTSVVVRGALTTNSSVVDYSTPITVSSGSPVQDKFSIAVETGKLISESWNNITTIQLAAYVADRLGNPVPDGTAVNFSASAGGTVTSSCTTANSSCPVTLTVNRTLGNTNPYITIFGYATGEEAFIDTNGNNKYDSGEAFTDLGNAYKDDDLTGVYSFGKQIFLTANAGTGTCPITPIGKPDNLYSVPNTCSGTWNDTVLIRTVARIYMAESTFSFLPISPIPGSLPAQLAAPNYDAASRTARFSISGSNNGGRAPTNTTVTVSMQGLPPSGAGSTCTAGSITNTPILEDWAAVNQPTNHAVIVNADCSGQVMRVTVSTPKGNVSYVDYKLP